MNEDTDIAYYIYGFCRTGTRIVLSAGIDAEKPPEPWPVLGGISAILSQVRRADFSGPDGETNLGNLAWIAPRVIHHQSVLEEAMRFGPVFPARFGTLFSSMEKLEAFLATCTPTISAFLDDIRDHEEWSVQGFMDSEVSEQVWTAGKRAQIHSQPGITPGMAYMMEERMRADMKQELGDWIIAKSACLLDLLSPLATESCERRLLPDDTPGGTRDMVSNWAFLVPKQNVTGLRTCVELISHECEAHGLTFKMTGPWPPYSFCPSLAPETSDAETSMQRGDE